MNGVPYDVAINLDDMELLAYCIAFGEINGQKWDWKRLSWATDK